MDELMDMIIADESPMNISDKIKEILFAKASDKIETLRPEVSNSVFGDAFGSEESQEEDGE